MFVIYDVIIEVGVKFFGMYVLNLLCLEKGYCVWKGDFLIDYFLFEGGFGWFVKFDKLQDFSGKVVIFNEKQ